MAGEFIGAVVDAGERESNFAVVKLVSRSMTGSGGAVWDCRYVQGVSFTPNIPGPANIQVSGTVGPTTTVWVPLSMTGTGEAEDFVGNLVFAARIGNQLYAIWPPISSYTTV